MSAPNDSTAAEVLGEWWATPPRTGLQRSIAPWEYRHLRASAAVRGACGSVANVGGILCLAFGAYGWAALLLVLGVLNIVGCRGYLTIDRSESPRG